MYCINRHDIMKLTKRQGEVLECIRRHIEATGYPPTRADIARYLGFRFRQRG